MGLGRGRLEGRDQGRLTGRFEGRDRGRLEVRFGGRDRGALEGRLEGRERGGEFSRGDGLGGLDRGGIGPLSLITGAKKLLQNVSSITFNKSRRMVLTSHRTCFTS
jgi:hypothetical protein